MGGQAWERRTVHYRGRVQGVGFRYTTARIAQHFDISGYVQNLEDGRVRLVVEGTPAVIERFLDDIKSEMASHIKDVQSATSPATNEFAEFRIRA